MREPVHSGVGVLKSLFITISSGGSEEFYALDCTLYRYSRGEDPLNRLYLTLKIREQDLERIEDEIRERECLNSLRKYLESIEEYIERMQGEIPGLRIPSSRILLSHILSPTRIIFRGVEEGVRRYYLQATELSIARDLISRVRCLKDNTCRSVALGYLNIAVDLRRGGKKIYMICGDNRRIRLTSYEKILDIDRILKELSHDLTF
ncbi:MAG: hypothetical protein QXU60_05370 [Sulfolobales archaeon]